MKNLKKTLALFLCCIMLVTTCVIGVSAGSTEYVDETETYAYTLDENNNATIIDSDPSKFGSGTLVIPSKIDGYTVTGIGEYAFESYALTEVIVPDTVTEIDYYAFRDMPNIEKFDTGDGLEEFPYYLFDSGDFLKLKEINLGKKVKMTEDDANELAAVILDSYTWFTNATLPEIKVSEENTNLQADGPAIYDEEMESLLYYNVADEEPFFYLPETVKRVMFPLAFAKNIANITFNDKFTLMDDAENDCEFFKSIADATEDGAMAIMTLSYFIPAGAAVNIPAAHAYLSSENGVLYNKDKTMLIRYPNTVGEDNAYTVPETVKWINSDAFAYAEKIDLTIPASYTENLVDFVGTYSDADTESEGFALEMADYFSQLLAGTAAKKITVGADDKYIASVNGVLYSKDLKILIKYPVGSYGTYYELPETVEAVLPGAFAIVKGMTSGMGIEIDGANELTVHVTDDQLKNILEEDESLYGFIGVKEICTESLTVDMKEYNKAAEERQEQIEAAKAEIKEIFENEEYELIVGFEAAIAEAGDDPKAVLKAYVDFAYENSDEDLSEEDYEYALAEIEALSDEEAKELCNEIINMLYAMKYMYDMYETMLPMANLEIKMLEMQAFEITICKAAAAHETIWRTPVGVKTPSVEEIDHGETLILHAEYDKIPEGAKFVWSVTGEGVEIAPSEDGKTCEVTSVDKGTATVKLTVVDENGKPVKDENGNDLGSEIEIKSNSNIWLKIVSFFKNLFRIDRIIPQAVKVINMF